MTILEMKPLSMPESLEIAEKSEEKNEHMIEYFKRFVKIKPQDAKELKSKLEALGIMKLNDDSISKIIDVLPESASALNKVFVNDSLEENENNKILEIVKKYI